MSEKEIYLLKRPCLNRGLTLKNNRNGTVLIDGELFSNMKDCEEFLIKFKGEKLWTLYHF
jgi:hypothetical protein